MSERRLKQRLKSLSEKKTPTEAEKSENSKSLKRTYSVLLEARL